MSIDISKMRCSYISIFGLPNAGKSTLLNTLIGKKISIVTPKVQTTRTIIRGVCVEDNRQLIFVDTPGLCRTAKRQIEKAMLSAAWFGIKDCDKGCFIVDVKNGLTENLLYLLKAVAKLNMDILLVLNKIDLVKKEALLLITDELNKHCNFVDTFMISALKKQGVDDFKSYLFEKAENGPWLYPEGSYEDLDIVLFSSEITREKMFMHLQEEIPYQTVVVPESCEVRPKKIILRQIIYVISEAHKKIMIGKKGSLLKKIGTESRLELEIHLKKKVDLFLFVKVKNNWQSDKSVYNSIGLSY